MFQAARKEVFLRLFAEYTRDFLDNYMEPGATGLDRHKNAAVIVRALAEATPLTVKRAPTRKQVIANEILAINVALSYMRESLQAQLKEHKGTGADRNLGLSPNEINVILSDNGYSDYLLPIPFSCPDNNYAFVIARDVYFTKEKNALSCLTLANIFFLVEYSSIQEYRLRIAARQK